MRKKITISEGILLVLALLALAIAWSIASPARAQDIQTFNIGDAVEAPYALGNHGVRNEREPAAYGYVVPLKDLPPGFVHWTPLPPELQATEVAADGVALCRQMGNAIALASLLWDGWAPKAALARLSGLWHGDCPCGYAAELRLRPVAYAIRGDQRGRKVALIAWRDQYNRQHITGTPKF